MTVMNHILGFPRIGSKRELKQAQEQYWSNKISKQQLLDVGSKLRLKHWRQQKKLGIDLLPVGDFAWYDHVLSTSMLLGNIPNRHQNKDGVVDLDTLFYIARGTSPNNKPVLASEMTKWFNTNYHYIVPEFIENQTFNLTWCQLFHEIDEALNHGYKVKPVLLGPITYLWLGKIKGNFFNRLDLLQNLLQVYQEIFCKLEERGIEWVQIDEPILALELPQEWLQAFQSAYTFLSSTCKLLLTTYFGSIEHNLDTIIKLPVQGLHIDLVHGTYNLTKFNQLIPDHWILSLGIINGRNIWKSDLKHWFKIISPLRNVRQEIWISGSCSFLHCPVDLKYENNISLEVKNWFSFAIQKCYEINLFTQAMQLNDATILEEWSNLLYTHHYSNHVNNISVQKAINNIHDTDTVRNTPYVIRSKLQKKKFNFSILPTTTIGSFPQTEDIRKLRLNYKNKIITFQDYSTEIKKHIKYAIRAQEALDLDVLVHGESERSDMVEYFGEHLNGFVFTDFGWVQSYGSRCVKPPIIIGDIYRSNKITIEWLQYAQSLTKKPVKAMLTGPVTILSWSFIREDLPKEIISNQIALALRDEVSDLEQVGIHIIQIDEPALREGLPLKQSEWNEYLSWATKSFRLASSQVQDITQIHTHMCYCEFQDIMNAIVELDADVITIETARSDMELLRFFKKFQYPNEIGPGVYDIHSPNIPNVHNIESLLNEAIKYIPIERLWVNPDCGLKTRSWKETKSALKNMVFATKNIRKKYQN
ncbi:5-methyltetrahydropteroyltriglutamate--homocysteine S-methyltransferase [Buchnera aphidicola (Takecallis taiwana)]|uniref:5-methyltetrahydropteroyltriglutamate-- homocysteine S-methyltransferase n=1 Tax=Buchnera aphidicola TaxID=9 RepID=UPI0031B67133